MANKKITDLPVSAALIGSSVFEGVSHPAGSNISEQVSAAQIAAYLQSLTFVSALQAISTTNYSIAHGLGATPSFFRCVLVCVTNDAGSGAVVGDEIDILQLLFETFPSTVYPAFLIGANATNCFATPAFGLTGQESSFSFTGLWHTNNNSGVNPTSFANFMLKFYARL